MHYYFVSRENLFYKKYYINVNLIETKSFHLDKKLMFLMIQY
jgi:hypothetical protein